MNRKEEEDLQLM